MNVNWGGKEQDTRWHCCHLENEVFENQEQIAVSKFYESLPKPWAIAMQELMKDEIYVRQIDEEENADE